MCIFNKHPIDFYCVNMAGKPAVTIWISFLIILIIQMVWVPATHMDDFCNSIGDVVEKALQPVNSKINCVLNQTCKERFIDLNMATARIDKR